MEQDPRRRSRNERVVSCGGLILTPWIMRRNKPFEVYGPDDDVVIANDMDVFCSLRRFRLVSV